ncbi:alginate export family protein [Biformimicrobium ophioploci]|uniref:Alginate export domain-containing protein n=1 Tax=Biformimicrobium ophioploci TaxID=3036711 RepID=A0ABQ6M0B5_9GAMM|nr:alginate export family protein [Microbulbifer sp. NKW57]GMG87727.1 hypothetical protein MNKW57_20480 [Microbulbifer sp. NKW57]
MLAHTTAGLAAVFLAMPPFASPAKADHTQAHTVGDAVCGGCLDFSFRLRHELVDQDSRERDANARTLRSRVSWHSGTLDHWNFMIEVDDISVIGSEDYNSTVNGRTDYPVVADPTGTEVNQALFRYKTEPLTATFGRQRIIQDNARFIGNVGWRQNEQTYDAVRGEWAMGKRWRGDLTYSWNVNRIFGPDGPTADLEGDVGGLRLPFAIAEGMVLTPFAYWMDFNNNDTLSNQTVGLQFTGKAARGDIADGFQWTLSAALQTDNGDNPNSYNANYFLGEIKVPVQPVTLGFGYEVLSGEGDAAFITPLATLHKFQGWADTFLNTPGDGVKDAYASLGGKLCGVQLGFIYHNFRSDRGDDYYGDEYDFVATFKVNKHLTLQAKYANYNADGFGLDTEKFWLSIMLDPT